MEEDDSKIVVYRTYLSAYEAYEAKNILAANGVQAFLSNENMSTLYPVFNEDIGVGLLLLERDRPLADRILSDSPEGNTSLQD